MPRIEMPRVGDEYAGYRIVREIGRGGMGMVYLGEHLHLERRVALKLLAAELAQDDGFRQRFLRESRLAASLQHPHIVPIYDAGESEGLLYISMLYVDGPDLKALLRREGPLEVSRAASLLEQIAGALDEAHEQGLVHRDVKPQNVLIARSSRGEKAYLTDFGLTKRYDSKSGLTAAGTMVGTVDYMAPEQLEGLPVDPRADVYSLACLVYECLSGKPPYETSSLMATIAAHLNAAPPRLADKRRDVPPALDGVIARGLAKSPGHRQASCGQLIEELRAALATGGSSTLVAPTSWEVPQQQGPKVGETVIPPVQPDLRGRGARGEGGGGSYVPTGVGQWAPTSGPPPRVGPEPVRSSRGKLLIGIGVSALVVVIAVALFMATRSSQAPDGARSGSLELGARSVTTFTGEASTLPPERFGDSTLQATDTASLACVGREQSQISATYASFGGDPFETVHNLCLYSSEGLADDDARATVAVREEVGFEIVEEREVLAEDGSSVGFAVLLERSNAGNDEIRESLVWTNGPLSASLNSEETGVVLSLFQELPY